MLSLRHKQISIVLFGLGIICANVISHHVHPFRTFYNELAAVIGLLLAAVFLFCKREAIVQPKLVYLPISILLMMMLQLLLQRVYPYQISFPVLYLGLTTIAIFYGSAIASEENAARMLCDGIAFSHLIAALASVLMENAQVLGWDLRPFVMYMAVDGVVAVRPFANIAQPNQLALLLCFGLAAIWWLRQQQKIHGGIAIVFAAFIVWGIVLTQSRIAWLILPLFVIMTGTGFVGQRKEHIVWMLGLLALYALAVFFLPTISAWMGFSSGSVIERIGGRSERTVLAQQAISMIASHPWLGVGWFGFGSAQVDIGANFTPTIYAEHSHNFILNIAAELGLPFAILFFGAFGLWLIRTCGAKSLRVRPEIGLFLLFLVAIAVHSLVEFPLWYAFVLIPLAVLAGMAHGLRWTATETRTVSARSLQAIAALSIVFCGLIVIDFHRVVEGFNEFRRAKNYAQMDLSKISSPRFTLMPDYYDYFSLMRIVPAEKMTEDEIRFVEQTSHRFGYVHILSKLAEIYVLNNRLDDAAQMMKTLHRLHPFYYPEYYDYWRELAKSDVRYEKIFLSMPAKE
ncbi:O-antigen ligase C-terminal domain-containing protein [Undibacterium sp. LX40W]|uniref:O-antigen ligase C-terminal domain-containing protein n=1 Tax=Undibacterium nitidum TaxID=2762298 RepID=A0A923HNB3_9BURK|nr:MULTISPECIES: O-antigen ligase family protein [Undibacterium]MBC3880838.1 O-antigen ligase C-terminal domain-containing protein [Undibacterium nitidum]MBC3890429.1 O-antigen ligase C-terminal domain-containing protein [Undibacterium sp. LX40W]